MVMHDHCRASGSLTSAHCLIQEQQAGPVHGPHVRHPVLQPPAGRGCTGLLSPSAASSPSCEDVSTSLSRNVLRMRLRR